MKIMMAFATFCVALGSAFALPATTSAAPVQTAAVTYTIHGRLTLYSADYFDGIQGASVVVLNANNRVIGAATTSDFVIPPSVLGSSAPRYPYVTFKVGVPKVKMYQIKIGTHDGPVYTFKQLVKAHWKIKLTLGQP